MRTFMGWMCPCCRTAYDGRRGRPDRLLCGGDRYVGEHRAVVCVPLWIMS